MSSIAVSFPRQYARTQRFTLGNPRSFTVAPDGSRVVFLRTSNGLDRTHRLWVQELAGEHGERVVADPAVLLQGSAEELSAAEAARRERTREGGAGIVGYATDAAVELAAFTLSGRLFVAELRAGTTRELPVPGPVIDPRPSPDGRAVAYVSEGALRVVAVDGSDDRVLARPEHEEVTYGLAEFVAAEEMHRHRGYWWAPDSSHLLVARVDDSPVQRWWIADPANPHTAPRQIAYPAAGTANSEVTLELVEVNGTGRTEVVWDRTASPYLAAVHWSAGGPPLLLVQARDQREQRYLTVNVPGDGSGEAVGQTRTCRIERDTEWLELIVGAPAWAPGQRLLRVSDESGARTLVVGDRHLTGPELQVRAVLDVGERDVLFSASPGRTAVRSGARQTVGDVAVYRVAYDAEPDGAAVERVSGAAPQVASAARGGDTLVLVTATLDRPGPSVRILGRRDERTVRSHAHKPELTVTPRLLRLGDTDGLGIPTAVLLPSWHSAEDGPLPVLLDPYGGPHGGRVLAAHHAYLTSQWFADQGFAVIVADGRGTPGASPAWEKAIAGRLAETNLEDQVAALHAVADTLAGEVALDLGRVGVRGWSYGGYLSALAVLRRPDVFHAAVVGAPVTDLRLYDTHYTERYLGDPRACPEVYAANSVVTDEGLSQAATPHRPMMIVHGLADDNVAVAHGLRLSSALLAAGRPHEVLPLSGVTHMTPQEQVAENLLLLQVDFLKRSLGC